MADAGRVDSNVQVELAVERTRLALERTQLAWIRTAFAIISAGLALDRGIQALFAADLLQQQRWLLGGHIGGVFLAAIATVNLAWATAQYVNQAKVLIGNRSTSIWTPTLILSALVALLGLCVVVVLLLWR